MHILDRGHQAMLFVYREGFIYKYSRGQKFASGKKFENESRAQLFNFLITQKEIAFLS